MSKQYKNKTCAYCGRPDASSTGDHVFARALVEERLRGEIPVVPACDGCNNAKAALEHYAASLLPFGGRHSGALARLTEDVPRRLAKNQRLHRDLALGQSSVLSNEGGIFIPAMTLPLDGARIQDLVGFTVRGLMFHHWGIALDSDNMVLVHNLTPHGEEVFAHWLRLNARARVTGDIGEGALVYRGAQGVDNPCVSFWEISLYGGLKTMDKDGQTASTKFGILTGPTAINERAQHAIELIRGGDGTDSEAD
jgi:hypothetical protein